MDNLANWYSGLFCSVWIMIYLSLIYTFRRIPYFEQFEAEFPSIWPKLSVIVPACNEAEYIEGAARSLIEQDYPNLEIILVNDRSSDETGQIIDRLAREYNNVKAIQIKKLPVDWLGKVHALSEGKKHASGDWMLLTDADVGFSPGVLKKAIAYVQDKKIDHLALMPNVEMNSFWLEVAIRTFGLLFFLTTRVGSLNKPNSKAIIGVGAFNLVNMKVFDKTPGFEWLRMETVDDMGVGLMMKQAGGKSNFAFADKELNLSWYESIPAMYRGLEKNLFGAGPGYSVTKLSVQLLLLSSLFVAPALALSSNNIWLLLLVGVAIFIYIYFSFVFVRHHQKESLALFLFPVGLLLIISMMIWSAYKCVSNQGINWRGTHYSIKALRKGRRVKL